jgi:hypothetical protein
MLQPGTITWTYSCFSSNWSWNYSYIGLIGRNFIEDVFLDGGSKTNNITEKLWVQLRLSKPKPPYNLHMVNLKTINRHLQTILKLYTTPHFGFCN